MGKQAQQENVLDAGHGHGSLPPAVSSTVSRPRRQEEHPGGGNTLSKLMRREIGGLSGRPPPPRPDAAFGAEKFRRFKVQEEFNVCADTIFIRKSITSITAAKEFIFVLGSYGICVAFRQTTNGSILPCQKEDGSVQYFNCRSELIKMLFYNKNNDAIIIVSFMLSASWTGYLIRAIPLETVRTFDDWDGVPVLGSWADSLPFFDDCNNIAVISLLLAEPMNHVYEMNSYGLVHTIAGKIHSITTRPGVVIVAYQFRDYLPIEVLSTENWRVLKKINYSMPPPKELEYVEIFKENIFLKERGKNMKIIDIWNHDNVNVIEQTNKHQRPLLSFDLIAKKLLLRFSNDIIVTSNSCGDQVTLLEDNNEMPAGNGYFSWQMSDTYVTKDKSYAIYYSRKSIQKPSEGTDEIQVSSIGSINVYSTFSGKPIVNICPCNDLHLTTTPRKEDGNKTTNIQSSIHEALQDDITALFYDEEHQRIYAGNKRGFLHVWSN